MIKNPSATKLGTGAELSGTGATALKL